MPTYRLSINNLLRAYADLDQAAEEIAYFAQAHRQPEPAFDLDTQHSNPWYNALVVQFPALDAAQQRLWQSNTSPSAILRFLPPQNSFQAASNSPTR